jgi:hypothetical protein
MKEFGKIVDPDGTRWIPAQRRIRYVLCIILFQCVDALQIRCMEHSLHLGAGHFVKGVAPTSSPKILKKVQRVLQNARDGGAYDLDQLDADLADIEDEGEDGDGDEGPDDDDSECEFEIADSIGKALALVNQVSI